MIAHVGRNGSRATPHSGPSGGFDIFYGDQADEAFLKRVLIEDRSSGSQENYYDIIIDDGGHTMQQQQTSFAVLYSSLRKGGVYVIEDMNTSFKTRYGGTRRPNCTSPTTANMIKSLYDEVHTVPVKGHAGKMLEDIHFRSRVERVDCFHFICFITKR